MPRGIYLRTPVMKIGKYKRSKLELEQCEIKNL